MAKTRKMKTRELLELIGRGPSFGGGTMTAEQAEKGARLWLSTWVLPLARDLIKEAGPMSRNMCSCTTDIQIPKEG